MKEFVKFHKNGTIWAKGFMKNDKQEGYWEFYRIDGSILRSGSFKDGKQVGIWTTYDKLGKVYKTTILMKENVPHKTPPADFAKVILSNAKVRQTWEAITPLARSEWICFLTSTKTEKGKLQRYARAEDQLARGQKRPCCWPGCPHRNPNAAKYFK